MKRTKEIAEKTKFVVVVAGLRVPIGMRADEIKGYARKALMSEHGHYPPKENGYYATLNKDRIEVLMP